jgi:hyperosmotically inducible periplasmic protein
MNTRKLLTVVVLAGVPLGMMAGHVEDRKVEDHAKASYNFRQVLDKGIDIKVQDGVATLTGRVRTDDQKRLAEDTVAGIDGVTRVDNQLRVEGGAREGSDEWLAMKIRARLAVKANVSMTHTDVLVKDGIVTLNGTAENQAQKELTEAYTKDVDGVREVKNNLAIVDRADRARVDRDAALTPTGRDRETVGDKIDDGSITAQIKFELFSHRSTSGLKTKVNTNAGHVVISGEAGSDAEKDLVTKLAKSVRGVVDVDNNMTVKNH